MSIVWLEREVCWKLDQAAKTLMELRGELLMTEEQRTRLEGAREGVASALHASRTAQQTLREMAAEAQR